MALCKTLQAAVLDYNPAMPPTLRSYEPHDFSALYKLDQSCFPAGISYSKTTLRYFLTIPSADCTIAEWDGRIVGFILSEENPPLAHIITLDVDAKHRQQRIGTTLLETQESNLASRGVRSILLETAIDNEPAVAFWKSRGYRIEATLKRYYLGRIDAFEMRKILLATSKSKPAKKEA